MFGRESLLFRNPTNFLTNWPLIYGYSALLYRKIYRGGAYFVLSDSVHTFLMRNMPKSHPFSLFGTKKKGQRRTREVYQVKATSPPAAPDPTEYWLKR